MLYVLPVPDKAPEIDEQPDNRKEERDGRYYCTQGHLVPAKVSMSVDSNGSNAMKIYTCIRVGAY